MTLEQTLQTAITHHKAGELENAEKLYRSILNEQANHSDANHNLGVLLKQGEKTDIALPFFKTALESNPNQGQYWISYIDALIHLGQYDAAQNVLNQGQVKGLKGDAVDQLKERLNSTIKPSPESVDTQTKPANTATLANTDLEPAIQLRESGDYQKAYTWLEDWNLKNPNDPEGIAHLAHLLLLLKKDDLAFKKLNQALSMAPDSALIHRNLARIYLKKNKPNDALTAATRAFNVDSHNHENRLILASALATSGEKVKALKLVESIIKTNSNYAEAYATRALLRLQNQDLKSAIVDCEKALSIKPHLVQLWALSAKLYYQEKNLLKAIAALEQALVIEPDNIGYMIDIGEFYRQTEKTEQSLSILSRAVELAPEKENAWINYGTVLQQLERLSEAKTAYHHALKINPNKPELLNNLAAMAKSAGELQKSAEYFTKALSIDSSNQLFWAGFSNVLRAIRFKSFNDSMVPYLLQALQQSSVRPKDISRAIISMLRHHPNLHIALEACKISAIKEEINQLADQLTSIPLLLQLMELCPISDTKIECLLRLIRQATLRQLTDETNDPANLPFYVALALHCFFNEYVFLESSEETTEIEQLENKINILLANNKPVPSLWVALLASYRPLHIFSWSSQLSQFNSTDSIHKILTQQIDEVREEQRLRSKIKALSTINNNVSQAVREQYEENPYPRWVNPGLSPKPKTIRTILQELKIDLNLTGQHFPSHPEILIAGCGTGQHSLCTASRFSNSSVLAVDLSLSSLSYAIRKTQELGISNIDYMQADILELHKLSRQFDLIESSGVLHHMAEPLAGWEILVDLLRPRGLMKIGLYSEIARQHIVETRTFIAKNDYDSSQEAIRQCRVEIIEMPTKNDSKIPKVLNSDDFYSLSTCRDLLFHVQEHRFTLPEIETALKELGLAFIGFELQDLQVKNRFKELNSRKESLTSLPLWHQFELNHPDTFTGMYQFWVQKI